MSLRILFETQKHIRILFFITLICICYFNSFIIIKLISIFFQVSSLIGQVLVNKFLTICNYILHVLRLTYVFLQVLHEDALIFLADAMDKFKFFIGLLQQFSLIAENLIGGLIRLTDIFSNILEYLYYTLVTLKEGIKLLGSTIWNFFTILPEVAIFNANSFNEFILNTISEFKSSVFKLQDNVVESLKKTYLFLFDIPLNSLYGLIIGAVLLTIFYMKFKDICIFVSSTFSKLYPQFILVGTSLWSGRFLEQKSKRNASESFEDDERLCIVCQYRLKEIIIFPCKHLCLCVDCSSQLTKIRSVCPICRSDITGILKVYL